jgi:hypothetical protein
MKIFIFLTLQLCTVSLLASEAVVNVQLRPAGSFKAKTKDVKGNATKKGEAFDAANVVVDLHNLETGIGVRDEHTKKHLEVQAHGENGKGTGVIRIKGIEQKISGTYEFADGNLTAHFPLQLTDFKIEGIKYMGVGVDNTVTVDITLPVQ